MTSLNELCKVEDRLEQLIDKYGLAHIVESIGVVCFSKAEHIRENWQDERTAKAWEYAGTAIDGLSVNASVLRVSL